MAYKDVLKIDTFKLRNPKTSQTLLRLIKSNLGIIEKVAKLTTGMY